MKKVIFVTLVSTIWLSGCIASFQTVDPDSSEIKLPENNVVTVSRLGERVLESGKVTTVNGFTLYSDVDIFDGVVKAGEYHQIGVKDNHKVFGPKNGNGTGIEIFNDPSPVKPYVDGNTGFLCFMGGFGTHFCSDSVKPKVGEMNIYTADSFMQELIYTGKVDNKIRFTYREFQHGMVSQAYNLDVEYDLSKSNLISYKGAKMEIISASNERIEYKVLKHFN